MGSLSLIHTTDVYILASYYYNKGILVNHSISDTPHCVGNVYFTYERTMAQGFMTHPGAGKMTGRPT